MSYKVLIKGKPTTCQGGRGGATKDDIIAELDRRRIEYKKSASKEELCKILSKDDEKKEGKKGEKGKELKSPKVIPKARKVEPKILKKIEKPKAKIIPEPIIEQKITNKLFLSQNSVIARKRDNTYTIYDLNLNKLSEFRTPPVQDEFISFEVLSPSILEKYKKYVKMPAFPVVLEVFRHYMRIYYGSERILETGRSDTVDPDEENCGALVISDTEIFNHTTKGEYIWDLDKNVFKTISQLGTNKYLRENRFIQHPLNPRIVIFAHKGLRIIDIDKKTTIDIPFRGSTEIEVNKILQISENEVIAIGSGIMIIKFYDIEDFNLKVIFNHWEYQKLLGKFGLILDEDSYFNDIIKIDEDLYVVGLISDILLLRIKDKSLVNLYQNDKNSEGYSFINFPKEKRIIYYNFEEFSLILLDYSEEIPQDILEEKSSTYLQIEKGKIIKGEAIKPYITLLKPYLYYNANEADVNKVLALLEKSATVSKVLLQIIVRFL